MIEYCHCCGGNHEELDLVACIHKLSAEIGRETRLSLHLDEQVRQLRTDLAAALLRAERLQDQRNKALRDLEKMGDRVDAEDERAEKAEAELAAARRFKSFVHTYLDDHGIPHGDPDNVHQQEGCRIGARLDLLLAELAAARRERDALREKMERINDAIHRGSLHNTKATVKRLDVPLVTLSPGDAQAILDAAREALEKANGRNDE